MNTIKTGENLTVILPVMKDKQIITVHNFGNNETYIFKSEIKEVENVCNYSMVFNNQESFMENKPELGLGNLTAKTKRWKPKHHEKYGHVNVWTQQFCVDWFGCNTGDDICYATGNCYQPQEKERAIWEQVTRRKYETALWDAADWVEGEKDGWIGCFDFDDNKIIALNPYKKRCFNLPRFATEQSAIDAHTRILGDDAERYFKGRG